MHYLLFLKNKWTPLQAAVRSGHAAVVEALIKSGAKFDIVSLVSVDVYTYITTV